MIPSSLYIHIPFCASKCYYCDFNSYVSTGEVMDRYLDALDKEIELLAGELPWRPLETVFFGGGTPTMFDVRQTERMMQILHRHFRLAEGAEVSVEANPGTVTPEKLRVLREGGANRLSFGVQSFNDSILKKLGRLHDTLTVYHSYEKARQAGFSSINLDLMFGLPGQTVEIFADSLRRVLELQPEHISAYSLKVEEGTPFAIWQEKGKLHLPPEEDDLAMYRLLIDTLAAHGYGMYEISNFAKKGHVCQHNQVYWRNEPYLAAGAGAHGYVNNVRYVNLSSVPEYTDVCLSGLRPVAGQETIPEPIQREDTMILGLRMIRGVEYSRFRERHGVEMGDVFGGVIEECVKKRLLVADQVGVRLSRQALPIANEVFAAFLG
ncbi:radical SAM family heme chaperone HemW [Effusibacillus pohliae]|uniref:radical SAM family heme chaperone HemW n=1 Tax=Effusibacillus pohliae TaxID=232270 RepID=UPI00037EF5DB|nr:radical SAM family heme chaperone HemW [Effusibacillus pohliae]